MQGELYTKQRHGEKGLHEFSVENLLAENPQHLMFNGTMDALTKTYKMEANTGDNVRIYFGVGGPNLSSSFHVIGEVFDKVYTEASLTSPPLTDVQTTLVPLAAPPWWSSRWNTRGAIFWLTMHFPVWRKG